MRKLLQVFLLSIMILSLFGCHGKKESESFIIPDEFDLNRHYEISFWAKNDTNINQVNVYKQAIKDFEEIYPNITVNLKLYTDYSRIYNDVITNISTDTTPNICITYPDHIATYITGNNTVVPLDSLMNDEKYGLGGSEVKFDSPAYDEIVKVFLDECIINGSHYALPYMRSSEVTYINKDFVEKLGYEIPDVLTWDYIFEVSEAAMAKDEDDNFLINGQKVMIPFIYKSTDNMMISMLKQLD
ncbi:MAG: extracellular solute-binding protein, partial [Erysipelotrichaceae bacterium]|nr:extracellular solute-binding protein [Erysipelotrichaceae bacterium]